MAAKSGQFVGLNGHAYRVTLSGDSVTAGELVLAGEAPCVIAMAAGEHKFVGFKSQTCKVRLVTDVPMVELYGNSATAIRLRVDDMSGGMCMFDGFVTPFTYTQPHNGVLDVVEVDAVDSLTARKGVTYTNVPGGDYGCDRTVLQIVGEILYRAGIKKMLVQYSHQTSGSVNAALDKSVAQAGFLQDEVNEVDALSAVLKFFGYTGHVYGDMLYMYDEHYLTRPNTQVTDYDVYEHDGSAWRSTVRMRAATAQNEGSPLYKQVVSDTKNDVTLNVERAYDAVQITPSGSDVSTLTPNVCSDEWLEKNTDGRGTEYVMVGGDGYREWRMPLQSKVMDMGVYKDGQLQPWSLPSQMKALENTDGHWGNGAMMMAAHHYDYEEVTGDNISATYVKGGQRAVRVWMRAYNSGAMGAKQKAECRYSHTGGFVELRAKWSYVVKDWINFVDVWSYTDPSYIAFLQVKFGDVYFRQDRSTSTAAQFDTTATGTLLVEGTTLLPTRTAEVNYSDKVLIQVPNSGAIGCELMWNILAVDPVIYYQYPGIFIEQLELVGYGDEMYMEHSEMRHAYVENPVDVLSVDTMLTRRGSGQEGNPMRSKDSIGVNARPGVVPDGTWGTWMGVSSKMPLSGLLIEQLKARYGEPHTAYTMTAEGVMMPYKPTEYKGGLYTVEAYETDLYNSTTNITIN